jgi:hypothetical protein
MVQITPETVVYVSNAGTKEVLVLAMNRATGTLELIEKTPVPGTDKPSPASLPMATSPDKRFLYAQLRSEPYMPQGPMSATNCRGCCDLDRAFCEERSGFLRVSQRRRSCNYRSEILHMAAKGTEIRRPGFRSSSASLSTPRRDGDEARQQPMPPSYGYRRLRRCSGKASEKGSSRKRKISVR